MNNKELQRERISALRQQLSMAGLQAAIIPQADPHMSEYLAEHWQLRRWLSGFSGSAGTVVVTADRAMLWTDSRYFLQAAQELDGTGIELMKDGLPETPSIAQWLCANLTAGSKVGIDGMLFSVSEARTLRADLELFGIELDPFFDVADTIWTDRPALPSDKLFIHAPEYAGEEVPSKLARIMERVAAAPADATFISALDEIAWTLNIRCRDVHHNPVATGFLYIDANGAKLLVDPAKMTAEVEAYLKAAAVDTLPYADVKAFLASLPSDVKVLVEPGRTAIEIFNILGERAYCGQSAVAMLKACKNDTQVEGIRHAMERDGAALVRAFMELEQLMDSDATVTELDVDALLLKHRSRSDMFFDTSFGTIAGYGPHGAIVHYSADEASNATLHKSSLLLVDSGAQYYDGTTDITRTVALGQPTDRERHDFTLVMKGHIALGTAIVPEGTCGMQLDALARQFLWKEGLSYLHGTGHGVGHFLNVHEGPQSIRLNYMPAPLTPGMITSNEPGLYREGVHGIRCENLVLTVKAMTTEFGNFYKFETLTLFPFDLRLFDTTLMTDAEIQWINDYHREVRERLSPLLDEAERLWLEAKTAPLMRDTIY